MSLFNSQNDSWMDSVANSPVITRWNETRAQRRARKLRERAVARALAARKLLSEQNDDLGDLAGAHAHYLQLVAARRARELGDLATARAQAMSDAASTRSGELLDATSARADALRKQGADAIESARSRFLESDAYDRLKDIFPGLTRLDNRKQSRNNALLWVLGAALGVAAAGGAIYYFSRRRQPMLEAEPLVELPTNGGADSYRSSASNITSLDASKARGESEPSIVGVNSPAQTEVGPLVGNIRTMVYHDVSDDQELPSEENRIYFASETEAQEAGYRRAGELNEVERQ
ncbi:MAG TPA: hypothetical protein VH349_10135 [Ktedonobacterales bacterium]|jgi:hypothetical protein